MARTYLEVTYRAGKPFAAYFYLPRRPGDSSVRTEKSEPGLLIDYTSDGRAIGVEIISPSTVTLDAFNRTLATAHQPAVVQDDLAPLSFAG